MVRPTRPTCFRPFILDRTALILLPLYISSSNPRPVPSRASRLTAQHTERSRSLPQIAAVPDAPCADCPTARPRTPCVGAAPGGGHGPRRYGEGAPGGGHGLRRGCSERGPPPAARKLQAVSMARGSGRSGWRRRASGSGGGERSLTVARRRVSCPLPTRRIFVVALLES